MEGEDYCSCYNYRTHSDKEVSGGGGGGDCEANPRSLHWTVTEEENRYNIAASLKQLGGVSVQRQSEITFVINSTRGIFLESR